MNTHWSRFFNGAARWGGNKNLALILNLALGPNQTLRIQVKVTHRSMMFQGLATFSEVRHPLRIPNSCRSSADLMRERCSYQICLLARWPRFAVYKSISSNEFPRVYSQDIDSGCASIKCSKYCSNNWAPVWCFESSISGYSELKSSGNKISLLK